MLTQARKRRRKPCACPSPTLLVLLASLALLAGGVRGETTTTEGAEQAFETVPVSRYASGEDQSTRLRVNAVSQSSNSTTSTGRYGHAAVFQQYQNKILFIGGQVGTSGTYVTNDVLSLDMTKPCTAYSTLSGFTETTNPALVPELSVGLPPNAWSAYSVDAQERIWLIGGVTQDCESDGVAYVLQDASTWNPVDLGNYRPPRRRQAKAVSVANGTEETSIYIFGGVAEPYTCSLETVGYLAMDIWNTTSTTTTPLVDSKSWKPPSTTAQLERQWQNFEPAISDYAAVSLASQQAIVYIGGQDASGRLAAMEEILVFNTSTNAWGRQSVTGEVPPSAMGHSAILLEDSRIVVFGGVGEDGIASSKLRVLSLTVDGIWTWSAPDVSTSDILSPKRAWHTATLVNDGVIVTAFGLDGSTGETANDILFLKTTDTTSGWKWSRSNPLASDSTPATDASTSVYTPNSRVLVNAAAGNDEEPSSPSGNAIKPSVAQHAMAAGRTSLALTRPEFPYVATTEPSYETEAEYTASSSAYIASSTTRSTHMPAASASSASQDSQPASKSSVIAGTVTAAFVVALLAGAAALYVRKRASAQDADKATAEMDSTDPSAPPVSQLLYTRAAPKRMLSLGSAFSVHTTRNLHDMHDGLTFERVTAREAQDAVDEFGRLSPTSDTATVLGPTAHAMTHVLSADSSETQASVASYPFLTSVPRESELTSANSHEGHDLGLNLIRSYSAGSQESTETITPQFARWPSSIDVLDTRDEITQPRPSVDIAEHARLNPFDDFNAVRPDTPGRQRDMTFLPPSLRPGAQ